MRPTFRGNIPGDIGSQRGWRHVLSSLISFVFPGGVGDDEILRAEVRIFLELLDKDGDRLFHKVREMNASR